MTAAVQWRVIVAMLTALVSSAAKAADAPVSAPDWIVTVGLEARALPDWPGAPDDQMHLIGLPLLSVRKAGTPPEFFGSRDSIGFTVVDLGQFKFGPALRFDPQRNAADHAALNGLGNVDPAVEIGGFAEYWPEPWLRVRGELRQGIGGETGLTGDVFVDAINQIGALTLSAGPRVTLESAAAVSPYFSITPAQSAASTASGLPKLPVYSAGGGVYSYGLGTQGRYFWTPQWSGLAFMEYQRLTGDAANSPLVSERGSADQLTLGLGITYSFTMHPLW